MFIEIRKSKYVTGTTRIRLVTSSTHKCNRQKKSMSDTFNRDQFHLFANNNIIFLVRYQLPLSLTEDFNF